MGRPDVAVGAGRELCESLGPLLLALALKLLSVSRASDGEDKLDTTRGDEDNQAPASGSPDPSLDGADNLQKKLVPFATKLPEGPGPGGRLLGTEEAVNPAVASPTG